MAAMSAVATASAEGSKHRGQLHTYPTIRWEHDKHPVLCFAMLHCCAAGCRMLQCAVQLSHWCIRDAEHGLYDTPAASGLQGQVTTPWQQALDAADPATVLYLLLYKHGRQQTCWRRYCFVSHSLVVLQHMATFFA
jgi:hypothetical protein